MTKRPRGPARNAARPAPVQPLPPVAPVSPAHAALRHVHDPRAVGLALFALTLLVFLPAVRAEFICYDDPGYVTGNAWLAGGFTLANLRHAFLTTEFSYWHPLTWLSHLLDVQLFGLNPAGHHFTSVLLHAINAVLVFQVCRSLTGTLWRSGIVAACFALHPMHVESVAWVAERKDLLSTFFLLLAIAAYVPWARAGAGPDRRRWRYYALSLLAYAGAVMSKPMVVTLPALLLLLDWWPLRRAEGFNARRWSALLLEKLPFFALSAGLAIITLQAQQAGGAVVATARYPLPDRLVHVFAAYTAYVGKCVFPVRLAVFYPFPRAVPAAIAVGSVLLIAIVTVLVVVSRRRRPYLLFGWLWFLGTLVPVIGLVQAGAQWMADRYSYVPFIGLFIALAWGLTEVTASLVHRRAIRCALAAVPLIAMTGLTSRQIRFWRSCPTLFRHAIAVTGDNAIAHFSLGYHYSQQPGRLADAIAEYREALRIAPDAPDLHYSFATVLARRADTMPEAAAEYGAALRLDPNSARTQYGLGLALQQLSDRRSDAIAALAAAARLDPGNAEYQRVLGNALFSESGRAAEAIAAYRAALRLRGDLLEVRLTLAGLLAQQGRAAEAIAEYQELLRRDPDFAEGHNNLANLLAADPARTTEARTEYETTLRLRPDYPEARFNYALLLARSPETRAAAIAQLEAALRLRPDLQVAQQLLARLRAGP